MLTLCRFQKVKATLKPHIDAVGRKVNDPNLFDDIRQSCADRRAFLLMSKDGYIILKPQVKSGLIKTIVWFAYSERPGAMFKYRKEIERLCRENGSTLIEWWSCSQALDLFSEKHNYQKAMTVWSKEL